MIRLDLTIHQSRKRSQGLCVTSRCLRSRSIDKSFCYTCEKRRWAESNPERYAYCNLKTNAKRRGKFFDLTFEQFLWFLKKYPDYMAKRGRRVKSLQIDCIENELGYTFLNIRSISAKANRYKQHAVDYQSTDPKAENYAPW